MAKATRFIGGLPFDFTLQTGKLVLRPLSVAVQTLLSTATELVDYSHKAKDILICKYFPPKSISSFLRITFKILIDTIWQSKLIQSIDSIL